MANLKQVTIVTIVILSFILFIFPAPNGTIYTVFRIFAFISISFLFFYSSLEVQKGEVPTTKLSALVNKKPDNEELTNELRENYDRLLNVVFQMIIAINPEYKCATYMLDPTLGGLVLQKSTFKEFPENISHEDTLCSSILNQDEPVLVQQAEAKENWINLFGEKTWRGSECMMGVRLMYHERPAGCLILMADHFKTVNERDKGILTYLGKYISIGISRLQRIERLITDRDYHLRIANLFNRFGVKSDQNELFENIRDLCRSFFRYDKLTITLSADNASQAIVKMVDGFKEDSNVDDIFEIENTLHGLPYTSSQIINSTDWATKYSVKGRFIPGDTEQFNFNTILVAPIIKDNDVLGSIAVERTEISPFSDRDFALLEVLAATASSILSWQSEYNIMHKSAIHDGLTDLLNHKAYQDRFVEELSRAKRFKQDLVLLILDLDKFKRINDTYGHLYGDYVLMDVAKILKESIRNIDICARYGGEEFAIVLVNTDIENARPVAERIIEKVAEYHFNKDGIKEHMTISAGMSEYPKNSMDGKALIAHADLAMYEVKKNGGNGVIAHGEY
ncbi:MAG: diguanylate cyclase [Candidatus Marinimicrobia bacterium]|nr:diguanylate cyclase [Candidatus Neomarinimicrobiota bacterium]